MSELFSPASISRWCQQDFECKTLIQILIDAFNAYFGISVNILTRLTRCLWHFCPASVETSLCYWDVIGYSTFLCSVYNQDCLRNSTLYRFQDSMNELLWGFTCSLESLFCILAQFQRTECNESLAECNTEPRKPYWRALKLSNQLRMEMSGTLQIF